MRVRLLHWFDDLQTGFWFVPSLMLFLAAALAFLLLWVDIRVDPGMQSSISWAYSGGPEGARSLLSTIAGSMITAASVTFSLASVALSIASQQYGSRVLRNFMRDRITQVLLGTFVSTFLYCVLVVRSIRGSNYSGFVPAISITVGIVLALVSLLMLIYFVHHVSRSIQAAHIVGVISDGIQEGITKLYPREAGEPAPRLSGQEALASRTATALQPKSFGYLQTVDTTSLMKLAERHDLIVELLVLPGNHLVPGQDMARVWANRAPSKRVIEDAVDAFSFGKQRTPEQDIRYPFQQMTDVIVRALSPGINDPFTAINGIDELAAGLSVLTTKARPEEARRDQAGTLRMIAPSPSVEEILQGTVGHILLYTPSDHFITDRLRRALDLAEPHLVTQSEREALKALREQVMEQQASKA